MEHPWSARAAYVRRRWQQTVGDAHAPVALYGGGRHTRWLLERVLKDGERERVTVILDDAAAERGGSVLGVPVKRPGAVDARGFAAVVSSSDGIESVLTRRAALWARSGGDAGPRVVALYEGLPAGPYDGGHEPMFAELLEDPRDAEVAVEERFGPLTRIRRLPRVPRESGPPPVPPGGHRGGYDGPHEWYLEGGRRAASAVLARVRGHAGPSWTPADVLEWGCSSGRVLRHIPALLGERQRANVWGCDIDAWSTEWAATHLGPEIKVFRSAPMPPLPFASASMDLVYAISVFTHLAEHWDTWLLELRRVLRPGGYLFASINDERVWELCGRDPAHYIARLCPRLDFGTPMTDDFVAQGSGPHAQSFWSTWGVNRRWAFAFEVCGFTPGAIDGVQTGVVLRRPVGGPR